MVCPVCNLDSARRSHRRSLKDYVESLVGIYPYRCKCGKRFSTYRTPSEPAGKPEPVEREIRATRAAVSRRIKRREMLLFGGALLLFAGFLYYLTRERSSASPAE